MKRTGRTGLIPLCQEEDIRSHSLNEPEPWICLYFVFKTFKSYSLFRVWHASFQWFHNWTKGL